MKRITSGTFDNIEGWVGSGSTVDRPQLTPYHYSTSAVGSVTAGSVYQGATFTAMIRLLNVGWARSNTVYVYFYASTDAYYSSGDQ